MRFIRWMMWMLSVPALVWLGLNWRGVQDLRSTLLKAKPAESGSTKAAESSAEPPPATSPRIAQIIFRNGQKMVLIDDRLYPYNERGIYEIKGVKTLFKHEGAVVTQPGGIAQGASGAVAKLKTLGDKVLANPLHAYSPMALEEAKRTIQESQRSMESRDKLLKEITKE